MTNNPDIKICLQCGEKIVRQKTLCGTSISRNRFRDRKFCNRDCAGEYFSKDIHNPLKYLLRHLRAERLTKHKKTKIEQDKIEEKRENMVKIPCRRKGVHREGDVKKIFPFECCGNPQNKYCRDCENEKKHRYDLPERTGRETNGDYSFGGNLAANHEGFKDTSDEFDLSGLKP